MRLVLVPSALPCWPAPGLCHLSLPDWSALLQDPRASNSSGETAAMPRACLEKRWPTTYRWRTRTGGQFISITHHE